MDTETYLTGLLTIDNRDYLEASRASIFSRGKPESRLCQV